MHVKSLLAGAAASAVAFVFAGRVFCGDAEPPQGPSPEEMKLMQPGPQHEALKSYVGAWDGKGTYQGTPWTSKQTAKMVMGDRFLQVEEEITIPTPNGPMLLHSFGFVGYDNVQKKYVHTGVGDDSTALMSEDGQHDDARKLTEMRGVEHRPGKDSPYRMTIGDVAGGAYHMEVFVGGDAQPMLIGDYRKK